MEVRCGCLEEIPRNTQANTPSKNTTPTGQNLTEKNVTYTIEINGQFVLIENVPARVNIDTGEKYFSPETVERLHQAVWGKCHPVRTIITPVYEYTELVPEKNATH